MHYSPVMKPQKSKLVAILLALFLGGLGAHNFYVGNTIQGFSQLAMTVLGLLTLLFLVGEFLLLIVGVWVIVDVVLLATNGGYYSPRKVNWS